MREYGEARQNYQQAISIFIEFGDPTPKPEHTSVRIKAQQEFALGECKPVTPSQLMEELLA